MDTLAAMPRLVAVTIDRLPAWMLSSYGSTWVSTPAFDRLASGGVVFDRVLAPSVSPEATRDALIGSLLAHARSLHPAGVDRVENLEAAAASVAAGTARIVACHLPRLAAAWEAPADLRETYRDPEDPPAFEGTEPPDFPVDAGTDPDRVLTVRQAFAAELTFLDRRLGGLLDALDASPEAWVVLVAGTSGMPLGLHGQVGCERHPPRSIVPYGERVHLPVILRDSRGRMASQRFPGLVAAADVGATVAELVFGRPPEAGAPQEPRSLAGLFDGWVAPVRERVVVRGHAAAAVATSEWHLVAKRGDGNAVGAELYRKPDDYFEVTDVWDRCADVVEALLPDAVAALD